MFANRTNPSCWRHARPTAAVRRDLAAFAWYQAVLRLRVPTGACGPAT